MSSPPRLGIVVPTLNERRHLPSLFDDLSRLDLEHELVVVDGGSADGTPELARRAGARVLASRPGRGPQLNAGGWALDTPWILFLHADVRLSAEAGAALASWLEDAGEDEAAHFRFRLDGDRFFYRFAEWAQRARERLTGLAYGDQGLVLSRAAFRASGGFPDQPVMEDVEMIRKLRRSLRVERLPADLVSSPRRYERAGVWRGWLRNGALLALHLAGVPGRQLAGWYRPEPAEPSRDPERRGRRERRERDESRETSEPSESAAPSRAGGRILLVFAKAPREGRVKTRLARSIGAARATELYRTIGREVVDRLREGPWRTVVCYDPPDAREEVRSWLDPRGIELRCQDEGDLGGRMAAAFRWAFGQGSRVCIVGTDAPGLDADVVERSFRLLDEADLVLGPADDGGYYLMALRNARPALFEGIRWSTAEVLPATLAHASRMEMEIRLLEERTDLDTVEDLARLGFE